METDRFIIPIITILIGVFLLFLGKFEIFTIPIIGFILNVYIGILGIIFGIMVIIFGVIMLAFDDAKRQIYLGLFVLFGIIAFALWVIPDPIPLVDEIITTGIAVTMGLKTISPDDTVSINF